MSEDSTLARRAEDLFPTLSPAEQDRVARFGTPHAFAEGAPVSEPGRLGSGLILIRTGRVRLVARDGLGAETPWPDQGPGQFLAEIGSLTGAPSFVEARALEPVEAVLVPTEALRALLIAEADLGARITRALILRRVGLIEQEAGPVLLGDPEHPDTLRLASFLDRNAHPYRLVPRDHPEADAAEAATTAQTDEDPGPLVLCPDGRTLDNPSETELAAALGLGGGGIPNQETYDVAIIGAGPAGLAAAVYAASEGLSVLVLEQRAPGGQAGASARIENYLGFPTGVSGAALAGRALVQAEKFGAEIVVPAEVCGLERGPRGTRIHLAEGHEVTARTLVLAMGARYRRPDIPRLPLLEGRGVYYWASPVEARTCRNRDVALVGGGNSAGQAAVFLASQARTVHMIVRGRDLEESMSRYLIERIAQVPTITVHLASEIVRLDGSPDEGLTGLAWRSGAGAEEAHPIRSLFLFIGAEPATAFLRAEGPELDPKGFVVTGQGHGDAPGGSPFATSWPGVFAIGDVRSGSVKRVASAVGEGAGVVAALHAALAREDQPARPAERAAPAP